MMASNKAVLLKNGAAGTGFLTLLKWNETTLALLSSTSTGGCEAVGEGTYF